MRQLTQRKRNKQEPKQITWRLEMRKLESTTSTVEKDEEARKKSTYQFTIFGRIKLDQCPPLPSKPACACLGFLRVSSYRGCHSAMSFCFQFIGQVVFVQLKAVPLGLYPLEQINSKKIKVIITPKYFKRLLLHLFYKKAQTMCKDLGNCAATFTCCFFKKNIIFFFYHDN